ncbi:alpha/beta-hydrolase [Atractiella rhizophila]|nr:alpha/beta-hydrolase [Atractiella rhizophila]
MSLRYLYLRGLVALFRLFSNVTTRSLKQTPVAAGVQRRRIEIDSREPGRKIIVDVYEKEGTKGILPVHINVHASGFVLPNLRDDTEFCANLALKAGVVVLDADYRKSPEHPFPSAYHDILDVIAYARSQPASFDSSRLSVSGFSAGGNLVSAAAVHLDPGVVKTVIACYAPMDLTRLEPGPASEYDSGMVVTESIKWLFDSCLLQNDEDKTDPRISPYYADVERWPGNIMLACGEADTLWAGNKATVDKLREGGKSVEWISVEREAHMFDKQAKGSASEKRKWDFFDRAAKFVADGNS